MYNKQENQNFIREKERLIYLFNLIPTKETINYFVQQCFYDSSKETYRNLEEKDRETAHFYGYMGSIEEWDIKKKEYYSRFPKNDELPVLDYHYFNETCRNPIDNFEDLEITMLSVEILNHNYFEFKLSKNVKEFMEACQYLVKDFFKTKKHALSALKDELENSKSLYTILTRFELHIENLDLHNFYDLVETYQKDLKDFIDIIFNPFKPNDGIKLDNEPENKFPEIFITAQDYQGFMKYMKESFSNWHRDISYVKKRMEKEGRIEKQTDIEFTEFLYDNGFIKKTIFDDFMMKGQFDSLKSSESQARPIMYSKAFGE